MSQYCGKIVYSAILWLGIKRLHLSALVYSLELSAISSHPMSFTEIT